MAKVTPPSQLDTWFCWTHGIMPTLPQTPVTIIQEDGKIVTGIADEFPWNRLTGDPEKIVYWNIGH